MTRETGRAAARTMHLSLKAGERVYINGAVVRAGRKHGVPTPVNQTLVAAIKGIERRMQESRP